MNHISVDIPIDILCIHNTAMSTMRGACSWYRECHPPEGVPVARWDQRFQQHSQQKLCRGISEQASDQSPVHQDTTARLTVQLNNQWKINKNHHLTLNTHCVRLRL